MKPDIVFHHCLLFTFLQEWAEVVSMADFIVKDEDDLETNRQTDSECPDKTKMVISIKYLQYHRPRY